MKKNLKGILFALCLACAVLFAAKYSVNASAATKKYCTLKIYNNPGKKLIKTYKVKKGTKVTLPSILEPNGRTLLGFSKKKKRHSKPSYVPGQKITVNKNIKLYNVIFYSKNETNIAKSSLYNINRIPYKNVIFIGDSRTYLCYQGVLTKEKYPALHNHIYSIAVGGTGLNYVKKVAYPKLIQLLNTLKKEKTAIVFNSGVNDLWNINSYITFMNQIAPKLKAYNCKLFYMSVNPLSTANRLRWNKYYSEYHAYKPENLLLAFNAKLKTRLCGAGKNYTYIDTYTFLKNYGYSYRCRAANTKIDDGLHYTAKTYKRIYQYAMMFLKSH